MKGFDNIFLRWHICRGIFRDSVTWYMYSWGVGWGVGRREVFSFCFNPLIQISLLLDGNMKSSYRNMKRGG